MKSPMLTANPDLLQAETEAPTAKTNGYTDLQVLHSAAGYYIGTLYVEYDAEGEIVWQEPGSRDSDYYRTEAAAASALKLLTILDGDHEAGIAAAVLREHP